MAGISTERERSSAAPAPSGPAPEQTSPPRAGWLLAALLGATVLGTISNNVVNVPLRQITDDLSAPVTQGVLVASATLLVLAVSMPLTGWVSDRLGRRRTIMLALTVLLAGTVGAALAPGPPWLVAARAVQGLGCALVPVAVMGMLARAWPADRRNRVMGGWGAANGIGQAIGPPIGGLLADAAGWRSIFWVLTPVTVAVLVLAVVVVPRDSGTRVPIDALGLGFLTAGVALVMGALTVAPQDGVPLWLPLGGLLLGLAALAGFARSGLRRARPFIDPRLLVEIRWLRSATGVFVQQVTLVAALVAVPLHLTGVAGLSGTATGLLVFLLPVVWAASAPLVGLLADRIGPRPVLRTGLGVLLGVSVALAVLLGTGATAALPFAVVLVVAGLGVALVQTPSLSGATRSPAGQRGAGLGLFNMMRFVGASVGAAGVAAAYPDALGVLFAGCAAIAVLGLVLSFLGREVAPAAEPGAPSAAPTPAVEAGPVR
ncbi:MFS transporter [Geodermatophilus ruber]|uniref:Major Facilitator Superfamily protein n=1 Tax=Geodermatophilus ruber TaxID=504800 RepID=A0A1I4GRD7_9ACTN|nr:MFS transporter [Geodermatophilus ruber]SFL32598.1 Major Facilitator Superfamily protein [Geodermatophilus ruber]